VGEKCPVILHKCRLPRYIMGSFTCRKATTWDRRLYFPSEGRRAEDCFRPKNPTALAGCEPANLGTKGQHATSRQPKPLFSNTYQLHILPSSCPSIDLFLSLFPTKLFCVLLICPMHAKSPTHPPVCVLLLVLSGLVRNCC
jgi:hypothetical protein